MKALLEKILLVVAALSASMAVAGAGVTDDFQQRRSSLALPRYFTVFERELTPQQREALEFLYAYMPLPDLTDNSGEFFLHNVDVTLMAKAEMPWGKDVPELEFRHFVLPLRVNNEMLDNSREVFYKELKPRVEHLSMEDAILEVNHWCHEKATYQPSDARTHNPLATVYTAIGRCGEESTFLVAALRAIGIPARQIYTPRWAHTDDNHAWVEAWANGKWYFLGACEPEPVLNLGWFNAPASRGMLMSARVFGRYDGSEEKLLVTNDYTHINTTDHYAQVDTIEVQVVDASGSPVEGASVDFCLYNYAEYYPLVTKLSDSRGIASLVAGLGDLVVWASKDGRFGFSKATVKQAGKHTVALDKHLPLAAETVEYDLVPPVAGNSTVAVTPRQVALNDLRKAREDSIRNAYTSTFLSPDDAAALARKLSLDEARLRSVMLDARGNHAVIRAFLSSASAGEERNRALRIVELISAKDRSDVPADVLRDHLGATTSADGDYVLNPRVASETLTPYRAYFQREITGAQAEGFRKDPSSLVKFVADRIEILPDWNPSSVTMSPQSVWQSGKANAASRDIFYVALSRSLGMPARLDPVTGKTQWLDSEGQWHDASFSRVAEAAGCSRGVVKLHFAKTGRIDNPRYYTQFTISKINGDGRPQLLNYDEDATWADTFSKGESLDAGSYMLTSGQRMADGSVLARSVLFTVNPGDTTDVDLVIRQDNSSVQVIGSLNAENIYHDLKTGKDKSLLSTTGRGYYILGLIATNHEPSNHALRDIAKLKEQFEAWGRPIVLLFADGDAASRYDANRLPQLPSTVVTGTDVDGVNLAEIKASLKLDSSDLPIFVIADTFNRIVFVSQGYTIGLGDTLTDTIHKLD